MWVEAIFEKRSREVALDWKIKRYVAGIYRSFPLTRGYTRQTRRLRVGFVIQGFGGESNVSSASPLPNSEHQWRTLSGLPEHSLRSLGVNSRRNERSEEKAFTHLQLRDY